MPKKTSKTTNRKEREKELEKTIENLEEKIKKIESLQQLEEETKDKKQSIKEDLKNQLIAQNKFGKQFDDMIEDYLYFVELKEKLQNDLNINGFRYKTIGGNGFTTYKPNESYERLLKTNGQMLKILQDLELKAPDEGGEEEGDDLL
jgi:Tfp pilus assembly protein PilN